MEGRGKKGKGMGNPPSRLKSRYLWITVATVYCKPYVDTDRRIYTSII